MEIVDYLLARKKAGGSDVTIEQLSVTENGTYSEEGIAYSPVVVNVPAPENSYQLKNLPSGTVSTIEDGTDLPMSSLKVGIEPVQDLHGYDHPWAGGAGKNLANFVQDKGVDTSGNIVDYTGRIATIEPIMIENGVNYVFKKFTTLDVLGIMAVFNGDTLVRRLANISSDTQLNVSDGDRFYFCLYYGTESITIDTTKAMIVKSTDTVTSYEPYSNICPISGWTAANVTRSGKNILRLPTYEELVTYPKTNGYYNIPIKAIPNATYYLSTSYLNEYSPIGTGIYVLIAEGKDNNNWKAIAHSTAGKTEGILTANTEGYLYLNVICNDSAWNTLYGNVQTQLELGTTATTYEPYNGTTYNVQFRDGDNPLTVYGGTLDVVNGELVITHKLLYADGSFNVSNVLYDPNSQLYYSIVKSNLGAPANNPSPKSDKFKPFAAVGIGNCYITNYGNYLITFLPDQSADTVAKVTQWFEDNPTQFVYELATPTTYHLTPTQIRTLVGNNNIWADTGDVLSGKYFKEL